MVEDSEELASNLSLEWLIDGVLMSNESTDSSGLATFTIDTLSFGTHNLELRATDSVGLIGTATIDFTVNGIPSAPTISLSPSQPFTTDDITVSINVDSVDPEGVTPQYGYTWLLEGLVQSAYTQNTLPSSETVQGQNWTVQVSASDGITTGPYASASVTIENTTPIVSSVTISPTGTIYNDETVVCSATVDDPDESILPTFEWYFAGTMVGSAATLNLSDFAITPNNILECIVTATDSQGASAQASATTTIGNRLPVIQASTSFLIPT